MIYLVVYCVVRCRTVAVPQQPGPWSLLSHDWTIMTTLSALWPIYRASVAAIDIESCPHSGD